MNGPSPRAAVWSLRVGVVCLAAGIAATGLWYEGPVFDTLFVDWDWSEAAAVRLVHWFSYGALATIPLVLWRQT